MPCSTGSGDIDTSKVVEADDDGYIVGASGAFSLFHVIANEPNLPELCPCCTY